MASLQRILLLAGEVQIATEGVCRGWGVPCVADANVNVTGTATYVSK